MIWASKPRLILLSRPSNTVAQRVWYIFASIVKVFLELDVYYFKRFDPYHQNLALTR